MSQKSEEKQIQEILDEKIDESGIIKYIDDYSKEYTINEIIETFMDRLIKIEILHVEPDGSNDCDGELKLYFKDCQKNTVVIFSFNSRHPTVEIDKYEIFRYVTSDRKNFFINSLGYTEGEYSKTMEYFDDSSYYNKKFLRYNKNPKNVGKRIVSVYDIEVNK